MVHHFVFKHILGPRSPEATQGYPAVTSPQKKGSSSSKAAQGFPTHHFTKNILVRYLVLIFFGPLRALRQQRLLNTFFQLRYWVEILYVFDCKDGQESPADFNFWKFPIEILNWKVFSKARMARKTLQTSSSGSFQLKSCTEKYFRKRRWTGKPCRLQLLDVFDWYLGLSFPSFDFP